MLRTLVLGAVLLLPRAAFSQNQALEVASDITAVTVFLHSAQVTRTAAAAIPAGTTDLTFAGLAATIDPSSIQFQATGNLTVLAIVHRRDFLEDQGSSAEIARLEALKAVKEDSVDIERMMLEVYQHEEALIVENKDIGGSDGVQVAELQAAAAFFRSHLAEVKQRQRVINNRLAQLRAGIASIDRQLAELSGGASSFSGEVTVTVTSAQQVRSSFELTYLSSDAGWRPQYDLRVEGIEAPATLDYNANVVQATGEVWPNVRLTLSTGNPTQPGSRPVLQPWRLGFYEPSLGIQMSDKLSRESTALGIPEEAPALDEVVVTAGPPPVQTVVNTTTVEFAIDIPYTIAPDGKPNAVQIASHSVPALYEYYVAPKLDRDAFLTARITDWEDYYLLAGQANLFFEGTYVGKSFLDVHEVNDTLVVSLGRDKGLVVERTREKEYSRRRFLGNRQVDAFAFTIEVRNTKGVPVRLVVEDQVPVSTDAQIQVEADPDDRAEYDEATGLLRWRLTLAPGAMEEVGFSYEVRYPKGRRVVLE